MSENEKVPKGLRQGGEERRPKPEVEYKKSAWLKSKKKKTQNSKGCLQGKEWSIRPACVSCGESRIPGLEPV